MKFQWSLLLGLLFAIIVAVFAVINVENVKVDYVFGIAEWPLVLVILGSVLMGGLIIGSVGIFKIYSLQRKVRMLEKNNQELYDKKLSTKEKAALEQTETDSL